jgi:hypothetical protein
MSTKAKESESSFKPEVNAISVAIVEKEKMKQSFTEDRWERLHRLAH